MTPELLAKGIRRAVIDQSRRANVGHVGSALSIADLLAALYAGPLARGGAGPDRDRVILSKGHAALALYAALELTGRLPAGSLDTYCADGSLLGVHPERELDGVDFSTGSLGQGLPMAVGAALAARLEGSGRRTFAVLSDAELNEGSVWEAAMFAAHHGLGRLVVLVDVNGQQALGRTADVLDLGDVRARWEAFGWDALDVDGHDKGRLLDVVGTLDLDGPRPHVLLARTTFGRGVSFMERRIEWHYLPMTEEQHRRAVAELETVDG
jgi:transketolase